MNTVICAAAGLSSRMGAYKPLLPLGDSTIIRTLIARYRAAGVEQVVMVTGHNRDLLEEHVSDLHVLCRANVRYAESDMLQSVKTGVRAYLEEGEAPSDDDRVLITPCDIPLVGPSTIKALLESSNDICIPTSNGRRGHPICLSRRIVEQVLSYEGPDGLKGALDSTGLDAALVAVNDPGILVDADTPKDYEQLKQLLLDGC